MAMTLNNLNQRETVVSSSVSRPSTRKVYSGEARYPSMTSGELMRSNIRHAMPTHDKHGLAAFVGDIDIIQHYDDC